MGLEVWGANNSKNAYVKTGELLSHEAIIKRFKDAHPDGDFAPCYKDKILLGPANMDGIIEQP